MIEDKLWALFVPGPDEYHAAPSEAIARQIAALHNNWLKSDGIHAMAALDLNFEQVEAIVVEWPFGAEEHAEDVAEFDCAEWGLPHISGSHAHHTH